MCIMGSEYDRGTVGVEKIRTDGRLKIWMQALALAALLMFYPVSALWTCGEPQGSKEASAGKESGRPQETSAGEEAVQPGQSVQEDEKPRIALTFDDGPDAEYTPVLLDGLKERNVRATFFSASPCMCFATSPFSTSATRLGWGGTTVCPAALAKR